MSDTYPFMVVNADRLVIREQAGLEYKTASPYTAAYWKDRNVLERYYLQCQHYMKVLEMDRKNSLKSVRTTVMSGIVPV